MAIFGLLFLSSVLSSLVVRREVALTTLPFAVVWPQPCMSTFCCALKLGTPEVTAVAQISIENLPNSVADPAAHLPALTVRAFAT